MKKENENKKEFVNPFDNGVTYDDFLKALGTQKIEDYCKNELTNEQIEFLKTEIEIINNNKKQK